MRRTRLGQTAQLRRDVVAQCHAEGKRVDRKRFFSSIVTMSPLTCAVLLRALRDDVAEENICCSSRPV